MATDTSDKPGLEEQYLTATNTSDLTLNPDRVCAATQLIAAGLLGNRMGAALIHLRAEWDGADKPSKWDESAIAVRAGQLPKRKGKVDVRRARSEALVSYAVAMRRRAHALEGWLPALNIMGEWAVQRRVDRDLLSPALYHWLSPVCPVCDGVGFRWLYGSTTDRKPCFHCNGQRAPGQSEGPTIWPRPLGAERIHDWLKGCAAKARRERGQTLHGEIDLSDLRERNAVHPRRDEEQTEEYLAAVAAHFRNSMVKTRRA